MDSSRYRNPAPTALERLLTLRRIAIAAVVVQIAVGMLSNLLNVAAFQFRVESFVDPALIVEGGDASATLLYWGMITDLFSYYLPTAPIALAVWVALRPRGPLLAAAGLMAALAFVIVGSLGAVTLALGAPPLIRDYAAAGAGEEAIAATLRMLLEVVGRGWWQLLNAVLFGLWAVSAGLLLRREPRLGQLAVTLGVLSWLAAIANIFGLTLVLYGLFVLVLPAWTLFVAWLAVLLARRGPPFESLA